MPVYRVITVTRRASRSGADFRDISKLTISGASKVEKIKNEWKFSFQGGGDYCLFAFVIKTIRNDPILCPEMQRKIPKICNFSIQSGGGGGDQGKEWKFPLIFYLF